MLNFSNFSKWRYQLSSRHICDQPGPSGFVLSEGLSIVAGEDIRESFAPHQLHVVELMINSKHPEPEVDIREFRRLTGHKLSWFKPIESTQEEMHGDPELYIPWQVHEVYTLHGKDETKWVKWTEAVKRLTLYFVHLIKSLFSKRWGYKQV